MAGVLETGWQPGRSTHGGHVEFQVVACLLVVAPSREVPSQICAVLGQQQPFFAQNSPSKGSKQPNEGKRWLHSTWGLTFS